jgi:formate dehydrogenase major subunit
MDTKVTRRQFFRVCGSGLASSSIAMLGFSPQEVLANTREFKLERTTEARSTCPYCSVSCGVILYSIGDKSKNIKARLIHIEGDPDHPVNRGTLCSKGAGLLDLVHSPNRVLHPEVREPGAKEWKRISWDEALTRIAKHLKADRDAGFIEKNESGVTVNRWPTTGFLSSPSISNEASYLSVKIARAWGMIGIDMPARL